MKSPFRHAGDTKARTRAATLPAAESRQHRERPKVSVVAITRDDAQAAVRMLAAVPTRWERFGVELIVVCAGRHGARASLSATNGVARLIHGPADVSEQQLRAMGFAASTGDVVMLVDDLAAADESWIRHVSTTGVPRPPGAGHSQDNHDDVEGTRAALV